MLDVRQFTILESKLTLSRELKTLRLSEKVKLLLNLSYIPNFWPNKKISGSKYYFENKATMFNQIVLHLNKSCFKQIPRLVKDPFPKLKMQIGRERKHEHKNTQAVNTKPPFHKLLLQRTSKPHHISTQNT